MEPPSGIRSNTGDGPVIARSLAELEVVVRRDLAYTAYPTPPWIPARLHNGQSLLDVAIVGASQGGLGTAFGLLRERITNIQVFDRNQQGLEGPWVTFAHPAHAEAYYRTGLRGRQPDAARLVRGEIRRRGLGGFGQDPPPGLAGLSAWFRRVTDLPVQNDADVAAITPEGDALRLTLATPTRQSRALCSQGGAGDRHRRQRALGNPGFHQSRHTAGSLRAYRAGH
jgi:hypothetical protein